MKEFKLTELAKRFRWAIEEMPTSERNIGLSTFPFGACGDSSLLLGAYLFDKGIFDFKYMSGGRGLHSDNSCTSHAWLQKGTLIVDITSDQFPEAPKPIIVSNNSKWHRSFEVDEPQESDFRKWSGVSTDILYPVYWKIIKILKE